MQNYGERTSSTAVRSRAQQRRECPGNSGTYKKHHNAGSPGMVEKTFWGRHGDLGGRAPEVALTKTLCGLSRHFNRSEFWLSNLQKWIALRVRLSTSQVLRNRGFPHCVIRQHAASGKGLRKRRGAESLRTHGRRKDSRKKDGRRALGGRNAAANWRPPPTAASHSLGHC